MLGKRNFPSPDDPRFDIKPEEKGEADQDDMYFSDPYRSPEEAKKRVRQLAGLDKVFDILQGERKEKLLASSKRKAAFDNIDTSTGFRKEMIMQKQGVVSEVIEQNLISEKILKNYPTVYLGSGTDIEYPLALGSREIEMVDYILDNPGARQEISRRIEALVGQSVAVDGDKIIFKFDFGSGSETVLVNLRPMIHSNQEGGSQADKYMFPEKIGLILGFAAQGPAGRIELGRDIKSKLVEDGAVLWNTEFTKIDYATKQEKVIKLGH